MSSRWSKSASSSARSSARSFDMGWGNLRRYILVLVCLLAMPAGCRRARTTSKPIYTGDTETMTDVVLAINQNNIPVRTFWARHYYEMTVYDDAGKSTFANGEGFLFHRKPDDFRLLLRKPGM